MNIVVMVKQTFDTEQKIILKDGQISAEGVQFILNPYDEYAVEEAILWRDKLGGQVTVISLGADQVEETLRKALAMGADEAILLNDPVFFGDEYTVSRALAAACEKVGFDVILAGNQTIDFASGQVAIRVAELLDIPHIASVTKFVIDGQKIVCERDAEGDVESVETRWPALCTAQQGLNEPRYPSLIGIRKAGKKTITHWMAVDLFPDGLALSDLSARVEIVETFLPPDKPAGKRLTGELSDQVKQLVRLLQDTDKVV
ncbi:MAG: Electron transfer flavoprotein alpha/beta-subunit [Bacilli bacterium]|nr:Electron transfer flavoprotein alpha/beta-subunit [Bacilli bacterium]